LSAESLVLLVLVLVLGFWASGARQRLAQLRQQLDRAFEPLQAQMAARFELLMQWSVALLPLVSHEIKALQQMQAALLQARAACDEVAPRPHHAKAMATLGQAEEALAQARQHLLSELPGALDRATPGGPGMAIAVLQEEIAAADTTLGYARQQFNQAVQQYNQAVLQWPTVLLARMLGFRLASAL
jgi:LemA protein